MTKDHTFVLHELDRHLRGIKRLIARPRLTLLIWEATRNCNLSCVHCCNPKMGWKKNAQLGTEQAKKIFSDIAKDFDPSEIRIAITGGEPTLRKDLVKMVRFLSSLSFQNITLNSNSLNFIYDVSLLDKLIEAGMTGLTVSVDGLQEGYRKMRGVDRFHDIIKLLRHASREYSDSLILQTLSVVSNLNKDEIPPLMDVLSDIGIKYGGVSLISEVGRGETAPERLYRLSTNDLYNLLQWIAKQRENYQNGTFPMHISLVEDGWCGIKYELLTRPIQRLFFCTTGITIASILYDGKISACPHIAPALSIQGDALKERFRDVWDNCFQLFRDKTWLKQGKCKSCEQWLYCQGGPLHYRDETGMMKKCLFDEIREVDDYEKTLDLSNSNVTEKGSSTMSRIRLKDLPKDRTISKEEIMKVMGGTRAARDFP